jgi:hypothetical protein
MPWSPERRCEGPRTSPGAEAVTCRDAAKAPRRDLQRPSHSGPCSATLASNQVWGLTRTDDDWSAALEATLTATRRDDLQHGTTPAYVAGCVCSECRQYQRRRMTKSRK